MVLPNEQPKKPRKPKKPAAPKKSRERSLPVPVPASSAGLSVVNPDAAGIDVHSNMHMVCVPADRETISVRQFGANTADLQEIAAWLKKCRVKTVALESTGVYWIPLFELLESEGFEVYLVEPGQLSRCGARPKTDVLDAQWIQRLHSYGLLRASFRPPDFVLALRAYWRQRQMQVRYAAGHVQHMQKALEQMNVKLPEVVSDITGLTGISIIEAILEGERDPIKLAKLRDGRCHHSEDEIALALEGTWCRSRTVARPIWKNGENVSRILIYSTGRGESRPHETRTRRCTCTWNLGRHTRVRHRHGQATVILASFNRKLWMVV